MLCLYESGTRLAAEVSWRRGGVFLRSPQAQNSAWQGVHLFQSRIRRNIRLAEAPSFEQSIFRYAPQSAGAEDYRALAEPKCLHLYGSGEAFPVGRQA